MPYGILLLKRQAISFMIAYLYSAPAAYDTPMLAAYAAIVVGSPDASLRLLAMSMYQHDDGVGSHYLFLSNCKCHHDLGLMLTRQQVNTPTVRLSCSAFHDLMWSSLLPYLQASATLQWN
ncbi:hypothetical protein V8E54_006047 [Elaphomyces granulatus]